MDGAAFFREFLKINQGRQRKTKVLLASGNSKNRCPVVNQLLEEGVDMFLQKPVDLDTIRKGIHELIGP
jgi:CheY-like chemotaxis protein